MASLLFSLEDGGASLSGGDVSGSWEEDAIPLPPHVAMKELGYACQSLPVTGLHTQVVQAMLPACGARAEQHVSAEALLAALQAHGLDARLVVPAPRARGARCGRRSTGAPEGTRCAAAPRTAAGCFFCSLQPFVLVQAPSLPTHHAASGHAAPLTPACTDAAAAAASAPHARAATADALPADATAAAAAQAAAAADAGDPIIVETGLRELFRVAPATPEYAAAVAALPEVWVGPRSWLLELAGRMCGAMALNFRRQGLDVPPWRRRAAVLARWLVPPPGQACLSGGDCSSDGDAADAASAGTHVGFLPPPLPLPLAPPAATAAAAAAMPPPARSLSVPRRAPEPASWGRVGLVSAGGNGALRSSGTQTTVAALTAATITRRSGGGSASAAAAPARASLSALLGRSSAAGGGGSAAARATAAAMPALAVQRAPAQPPGGAVPAATAAALPPPPRSSAHPRLRVVGFDLCGPARA